MKIKKIILIMVIILIASYFVYGLCLNFKARYLCHSECDEMGAIAYDTIRNGELNINDLCVCYFPDNRLESFVLE